jgi:hypothetical protein
MRSESEERPLNSSVRPRPQGQADTPGPTDRSPERDTAPERDTTPERDTAPIDRRDRAATPWHLGRSSADRKARPRLGSLEYLLLALTALGVAITIAMFIVDPSGY